MTPQDLNLFAYLYKEIPSWKACNPLLICVLVKVPTVSPWRYNAKQICQTLLNVVLYYLRLSGRPQLKVCFYTNHFQSFMPVFLEVEEYTASACWDSLIPDSASTVLG